MFYAQLAMVLIVGSMAVLLGGFYYSCARGARKAPTSPRQVRTGDRGFGEDGPRDRSA